MITDKASERLFGNWVRWSCRELSRYYILQAKKDDHDFHCSMDPTPTSYIAFSEKPQSLCLEAEMTSYNPYEYYFRANRRRTNPKGDSVYSFKNDVYDEVLDEDFIHNVKSSNLIDKSYSAPIFNIVPSYCKPERKFVSMSSEKKRGRPGRKPKAIKVENNICRRRKRKDLICNKVNIQYNEPSSISKDAQSSVSSDLFAEGRTLDDIVDHYIKQLDIETSNDGISPPKSRHSPLVQHLPTSPLPTPNTDKMFCPNTEESGFSRIDDAQVNGAQQMNESCLADKKTILGDPQISSSLMSSQQNVCSSEVDEESEPSSSVGKKSVTKFNNSLTQKPIKNKRISITSDIKDCRKNRKHRLSKHVNEKAIRGKKSKFLNEFISKSTREKSDQSQCTQGNDPYRKSYITTSKRREFVRKQHSTADDGSILDTPSENADEYQKNLYNVYFKRRKTQRQSNKSCNLRKVGIESSQINEIINEIIARLIAQGLVGDGKVISPMQNSIVNNKNYEEVLTKLGNKLEDVNQLDDNSSIDNILVESSCGVNNRLKRLHERNNVPSESVQINAQDSKGTRLNSNSSSECTSPVRKTSKRETDLEQEGTEHVASSANKSKDLLIDRTKINHLETELTSYGIRKSEMKNSCCKSRQSEDRNENANMPALLQLSNDTVLLNSSECSNLNKSVCLENNKQSESILQKDLPVNDDVICVFNANNQRQSRRLKDKIRAEILEKSAHNCLNLNDTCQLQCRKYANEIGDDLNSLETSAQKDVPLNDNIESLRRKSVRLSDRKIRNERKLCLPTSTKKIDDINRINEKQCAKEPFPKLTDKSDKLRSSCDESSNKIDVEIDKKEHLPCVNNATTILKTKQQISRLDCEIRQSKRLKLNNAQNRKKLPGESNTRKIITNEIKKAVKRSVDFQNDPAKQSTLSSTDKNKNDLLGQKQTHSLKHASVENYQINELNTSTLLKTNETERSHSAFIIEPYKPCFVNCQSKDPSKTKVRHLINKYNRCFPGSHIRDVRVLLNKLDVDNVIMSERKLAFVQKNNSSNSDQ